MAHQNDDIVKRLFGVVDHLVTSPDDTKNSGCDRYLERLLRDAVESKKMEGVVRCRPFVQLKGDPLL